MDPKVAANWVTVNIVGELNKEEISINEYNNLKVSDRGDGGFSSSGIK